MMRGNHERDHNEPHEAFAGSVGDSDGEPGRPAMRTWNDIQGDRVSKASYHDWPNGLPERYGDWNEDPKGRYIVPKYTMGSDYCSSCLVEVSNYQVFRDLFGKHEDEWFSCAPGGYGTYSIVIDTERAPAEALEFYDGLEDYPLADEGHHSALELEKQDEAWQNWARRDFIGELHKRFGEELYPSDEQAYEVFRDAADAANVYWENESADNMYIDLERVAKSVTKEDVADWPREP